MPLYARDIIITPKSGSIIFSGSAEGGLSSSIEVNDSGSLNITTTTNGHLSINGIILATSSMEVSGSIDITGSLTTDDLIINNVFTLNGSLDLGNF